MIRAVKIVALFLLLVHGMCQKDGAAEVLSSDEISGNVELKLLKKFCHCVWAKHLDKKLILVVLTFRNCVRLGRARSRVRFCLNRNLSKGARAYS